MIAVEKLVKSYNSNRVLHGIDHAQERGEAVVLIGPSGCGKSTFLRCLNQLEIADSGRITIGGVTIEGGRPPRTTEGTRATTPVANARRHGLSIVQPVSAPHRFAEPHRSADGREACAAA